MWSIVAEGGPCRQQGCLRALALEDLLGCEGSGGRVRVRAAIDG